MFDSTGSPISPTGRFSSPTLLTFNTTITFTWTVPTSGDYLFACYSTGTFLSLVPYYINITNSNGSALAPRVGILRLNNIFVKNIYISNAANVVITCTGCSISLFSNTVPATFNLGSFVSPSSSASNTKTYTALAAGYYIIQMSPNSAGTITYQSDYYACPYD